MINEYSYLVAYRDLYCSFDIFLNLLIITFVTEADDFLSLLRIGQKLDNVPMRW